MKRFILAILFLSFFGFSSKVAASFNPLPRSLPFTESGVTYTDTFSYNITEGEQNTTWNFYTTGKDLFTVKQGECYEGYGCVLYFYTSGTGGSFQFAYETFSNGSLISDYWGYTQYNYSAQLFNSTNCILSYENQVAFSGDIYDSTGTNVIFPANWEGSPFVDKTLSITNLPALGGGVIVTHPNATQFQCNVDGETECIFDDLAHNSQVTLQAQVESGYVFSHWEINGLNMTDVDGEITIMMNEGKNVKAMFDNIINPSFKPLPRALPFTENGVTYTDTFSYNITEGGQNTTYNFYTTSKDLFVITEGDCLEGYGCSLYFTTTGTGGSFQFAYEIFQNSSLISDYWGYTQYNDSAQLFYGTNYILSYENQVAFSGDIYDSTGTNVVFPANWEGSGFITMDLYVSNSPELGGGVIITPPLGLPYSHCGVNGESECELLDLDYNSQVTLEAQPNSGYAFSHWVINNQTMEDVDGTIVVPMSEDKNVVAVFYLDMKLPLSGGKNWLLYVEPGGEVQCNGGTDPYHTGASYYSWDFSDNTLEDGHLEGTDVPIRAALGGFVDFAGGDPNDNGWGYNVVIDHGNGYKTRYAHLKNDPTVSGTVIQGQSIGIMGNTGNSTGIHLHFQIFYDDNSGVANEGLSFVYLDGHPLNYYQVGCSSSNPSTGFYYSSNSQ